jgi:hypothetical protein
MRVIEQEDRLAALRAAKQDTDSAILSERPPELKLTMPEPLVYQVWLEWLRTGRFFDSDQPPELWDVGLRGRSISTGHTCGLISRRKCGNDVR